MRTYLPSGKQYRGHLWAGHQPEAWGGLRPRVSSPPNGHAGSNGLTLCPQPQGVKKQPILCRCFKPTVPPNHVRDLRRISVLSWSTFYDEKINNCNVWLLAVVIKVTKTIKCFCNAQHTNAWCMNRDQTYHPVKYFGTGGGFCGANYSGNSGLGASRLRLPIRLQLRKKATDPRVRRWLPRMLATNHSNCPHHCLLSI